MLGSLSTNGVPPSEQLPPSINPATATAASGRNASATVQPVQRNTPSSRGGGRDTATEQRLLRAVERQAQDRSAALGRLAARARTRASWLETSQWGLPLEVVDITAEFGDYGLWATYHTGIDFNGDTGDPIRAVASGQVTSAGYEGSYGFKTVVTLSDGTEIWYSHQDTVGVGVGEDVVVGDVIGTVGATGNVTGSHLHLEVRPGGGDPVDPRAAFAARGINF